MRLLVISLDREEIVAVPHGLNKNERAVEHQRHQAGKDELRRAVLRAEFTRRKVWKNESKGGERGKYGQGGACSLHLESLFAITSTAHEQTEADNPIENNHNGGENRVARQSCFFYWGCNHDGDNQGRFNHRNCEGEDKRTEWLADAVCNDLRVVHGRE